MASKRDGIQPNDYAKHLRKIGKKILHKRRRNKEKTVLSHLTRGERHED